MNAGSNVSPSQVLADIRAAEQVHSDNRVRALIKAMQDDMAVNTVDAFVRGLYAGMLVVYRSGYPAPADELVAEAVALQAAMTKHEHNLRANERCEITGHKMGGA